MHLIWSKKSIKLKDDYVHCFVFAKNFDEANLKLKSLCTELKINIDDDKYKLVEFISDDDDTINFSKIHCESNFYYTKIDELENKKYIYILEFHESGGGQSYHEECYISWSYNLNTILEIATVFFVNESENTDEKDIKKMKNDLKKKGYHGIEEGISYECGMILYKVNI